MINKLLVISIIFFTGVFFGVLLHKLSIPNPDPVYHGADKVLPKAYIEV